MQFIYYGSIPLVLALTFTKLSIILLYQRIFTGEKFRRVTYIMLVLVSMWGIAFTLGYLLECFPSTISGKKRKCFDNATFNNIACVSTIMLDVMILSMPWPGIWRLQMSLERKIAVTAIFLLGGV